MRNEEDKMRRTMMSNEGRRGMRRTTMGNEEDNDKE